MDGVRSAPTTLDELAARLRARRIDAGSPSFTEITRRVGEHRAARGVRASERQPGRVTVYDCFRDGRRRVDADLVVDIVAALGADDPEQRRWRSWCLDLQRAEAPALLVAASPLSPVPDPRFVGRDELLERMSAFPGAVLLTGMGGAGKTALARQALRRLIESGRLGRAIEVSVRGSEPRGAADAADVLAAIARELGINPPQDPVERAERVAEALAQQDVGVLVDDISDLGQLLPLVRRVPATPLIATSRRALGSGPGLASLPVGAWSADEAIDYLRRTIGAEAVAAAPDDAAELVELGGRLPLAVALTAARIGERRSWSLADHRDALRRQLQIHRLDDGLRESIALSYEALGAEQQRALRLIAVQPCTTLSTTSFAALVGAGPEEAGATLRHLLGSHCVQPAGPDRVGLHTLMRAYAVGESWEADAASSRDQAVDRLAAHLLVRTNAAVDRLYPGHAAYARAGVVIEEMPREEATVWMARELDGVVELCDAVSERRPDTAIAVAEAVGRHLDRQGMLLLGLPLQEQAHTLAVRIGDDEGAVRAALAIGQNRLRLGLDDAVRWLSEAAEGSRPVGIPRIGLAADNARAIAAGQAGDFAAARLGFESALRTARENGFEEMVAPLIDNVAVAATRTGDIAAAAALHAEAFAISMERGDRSRAATSIGNLSEVRLLLGEIDAAVDAARTAVKLTEGESLEPHAYAVTNLGMALLAQGAPEEARRHQDTALDLAVRMNDPVLQASVGTNLGLALAALGDADGARTAIERARELAVEHGVGFEEGRALVQLAVLDAAAGEVARARTLLLRAQEVLPDADIAERRQADELLRTLPEP